MGKMKNRVERILTDEDITKIATTVHDWRNGEKYDDITGFCYKAKFEDIAKKLSKLEITIEVQVGEEDKMFGSVTNLDIHKALTEKDVKIDRQSILLNQPIKNLGVHNVPIKLSTGEKQEIKVYVIKA